MNNSLKTNTHNSHNRISSITKVITRNNPYIIWRYLITDFFFSFLVTLTFFIIIFIVNQLLLLTKNILQIDIPFIEVFKLLLFALPNILSLSIPFATLVACLMSVGHFSTFNEFIAMKANGLSFKSIFFPYIILATLIMLFSIFSNEVLVPWGTINFSKQYRRILSLNPQLGLEQNSIKRYKNDIIVTKGVDNQTIKGVVIIDTDSAGDKRVILADTAQLKNNTEKNGIISIELQNVNSLSTGNNPNEYNFLIGNSMWYNILLKDLTLEIQKITPDQQSLQDLFIFIRKEFRDLIQPQNIDRADTMARMLNAINTQYKQLALKNSYQDITQSNMKITDEYLTPYFVKFQEKNKNIFFNRGFRITEIVFFKKLSSPVVILLFVFIAFPMGLFYKRSGRTVGFGVGLILSFIYWFLFIMNQSIGINFYNIPAFLIMWYPNFLLLFGGMILFLIKSHN